MRRSARWRPTIYRLILDRGGVALTEFAVTAPFLILLFVGGYQLTDAVSAYRKLTLTTRAVADLTSQYTSVSSGDVATILSASKQVMAPYDSSNAALTVSLVRVNKNRVARVQWSCSPTCTTDAAVKRIALSDEISVPGTFLIVAQATYTYRTAIAPTMFGDFVLRDQIVMSPRLSESVEYKP